MAKIKGSCGFIQPKSLLETTDRLHSDIFTICLPMFPPFIMEQNASARQSKWKENKFLAKTIHDRSWKVNDHILPMFSMPFSTVSSTCRNKAIIQYCEEKQKQRMLQPPFYLNLGWFDQLAELQERSFCFIHIVQDQKPLPGDVLALQDVLCFITQGRGVRYVFVVLWDLPTEDHMAVFVHLQDKGSSGSWCV